MSLNIATMLSVLAAAVAGWIYSVPSPIDPLPYRFEKDPPKLNGPLKTNNKLQRVKTLFDEILIGPESFAADHQGKIYTGTYDGAVWRIDNDEELVLVTRVGINNPLCGSYDLEPACGRVKGMKFHSDGYLYAVESYTGLIRINVTSGEVTRLLTEIEGTPFKFANGLDISRDGVIYMTDSSSKWNRREYAYEVIEMNGLGRLISYVPATGQAKLLLDGLYLANGVVLSPDESFILINEMSRSQIRRYYLSGPNIGQNDIFIDNLPGYPDNLKRSSVGTFWVGLASARFDGASPIGSFLDIIAPYPAIKRFVAKDNPQCLYIKLWRSYERRLQVTPFTFYRTVIPKHAILLELSTQGVITHSFHDPSGKVIPSGMSEAFEENGQVYIGHFAHRFLGKISAKDLRTE